MCSLLWLSSGESTNSLLLIRIPFWRNTTDLSRPLARSVGWNCLIQVGVDYLEGVHLWMISVKNFPETLVHVIRTANWDHDRLRKSNKGSVIGIPHWDNLHQVLVFFLLLTQNCLPSGLWVEEVEVLREVLVLDANHNLVIQAGGVENEACKTILLPL